MSATASDDEYIRALLVLTLSPGRATSVLIRVAALNDTQRRELLGIAFSHHVVIRAFEVLERAARVGGHGELQCWAAKALADERARIGNAVRHMRHVCAELENSGCPVVALKTLDHWPDFGNDIDLYTNAEACAAVGVFRRLNAETEARNWGDRLANKWGFALPGLREMIELHAKCLGQAGEHVALARRFISRRIRKQAAGHTFFVPAPEERILAATLQRMYGQLRFRVCDFVDTAALVESSPLDYAELRRAAETSGIWSGVCSFLMIVSDWLERYRERGLELPAEVRAAAPFRGDKVFVAGGFLRVPVMPEAAGLYTRQTAAAMLRGDARSVVRLILLPPLRFGAMLARRFPHWRAPDLEPNLKRAISEQGN